MHKNEFIRQLARETNLPQKEVSQVVRTTLDIITRTLREGDKVVLTGFGTFEIRTRRARRGVNPQTKEHMTIPPTQTPGFTASTSLKLAVLNSPARSTDFENEGSPVAPKSRGRRKAKA